MDDWQDLTAKDTCIHLLLLVIFLSSSFITASSEKDAGTFVTAVRLEIDILRQKQVYYPPFNNSKDDFGFKNRKELMRKLRAYGKQFNEFRHKACATRNLSHTVDKIAKNAKAYEMATKTLIAYLKELRLNAKKRQRQRQRRHIMNNKKEPCSHLIERASKMFSRFDSFLEYMILPKNLKKIFPNSRKKGRKTSKALNEENSITK